MDIRCSLKIFVICVLQIANPLLAQQDSSFRKEWSDFKGFNSANIPSALYTGEVSSASNVILKNGVIETALGISSVSTPTNPTGCVFRGMVPFQNNSKQTLVYWCSNFGSWQEMDTSNNTSYLTYGVGESSANAALTTIYGTVGTENWGSHIKLGDYFKCASAADSAYTEISAVVSNSSLTLASAYGGSGSCDSPGGTYVIRKTLAGITAGVSGRNFYQGSMLNGWAMLVTGTENPEFYDGTTLFTNVNIASVAVVTTYKNRWFAANSPGSLDNLYWSPVNSTATWNTTATEPIFSSDGSGGIVSIVADDTSLVVFKRFGKIYRVYGEFSSAVGRPDTILEVPTSFTLGEVAPKTVIKYNNAIWFITTTGLYSLRSNEVKLMGRNFQSDIDRACITDAVCNMGNQWQVFSGVFDNNLYINLNDSLVLIDSDGNPIQRASLGDSLAGGFGNFNNNFYSSNETSALRVLRLEVPNDYTLYDDDGSTNAVNINYISESYCADAPEHQKEFKDFYILYQTDSSSATVGLNEILFDAVVDEKNTYMAVSSITTNDTESGRINYYQHRVGTRGNCIRWRIRENDRGRRNRIRSVVLRGNYLNLR